MKTWALQFFIFVRRQSAAAWLLAFIWLMVVGLAFTLVLLRETGHRNAQKIVSLQEDSQNLLATQQSVSAGADHGQTSAQQLQGILGNASALQEYLKKIFQIAGKKNLGFPTGSYKTIYNLAGGYDSYVIELPVTGSYQKIKELSEEILLTLPFGALEEMKFKRDSSSSAVLEVRLRFVLFLQADKSRSGVGATRKTAQ